LGARRGINYRNNDFLAVVLRETDKMGVDVVLDPVGADTVARNFEVLAEHGRLVQIGLLSGGRAEVDLSSILRKSLVVRGSRLRPRPLAEKIDITRGFLARFWESLVGGRAKAVIDRTFDIRKAQEAHRYVRENRNIGKVVLTVPE
jgi:NADPH2:quinone reductase